MKKGVCNKVKISFEPLDWIRVGCGIDLGACAHLHMYVFQIGSVAAPRSSLFLIVIFASYQPSPGDAKRLNRCARSNSRHILLLVFVIQSSHSIRMHFIGICII